ncbi:MAG TPA: tripartite tricarboxylate transporter permease, partial [Pseudolabrys sp.]|nr:tripartite tricarboxylate transporter permease [Pseudolabrys sp.]
ADTGLAFVLVIVGAAAALAANALGIGSGALTGPGFYPFILSCLLIAVGAALLLRAALLNKMGAPHWSLTGVAVIAAVLFGADWAWSQLGRTVALRFGPAELLAITVLKLALIVALARASRLRAFGMVLLGLLVASVGVDVATGVERFESLADGISAVTVLLGFAVADGALGLAAPSLLLASYGRKIGRPLTAPVSPSVGVPVRLAGVLLIAAALSAAFILDGTGWPAGQIVVVAVFGIACQLLGWNRPVLLVALLLGPALEENLRRTLLISRGSVGSLFTRPISGPIIGCAVAVLVAAIALSAWRVFAGRKAAL